MNIGARLINGPLRYLVRQVLGRPWLKQRLRQLLTRMPRTHGLLLRVLARAPGRTQGRVTPEQAALSPHARRIARALQQALRSKES